MKIKAFFQGFLFAYIVVFVLVNSIQVARSASMMATMTLEGSMDSTQQSQSQGPTDAQVAAIAQQVIPQGVPAVYGPELNVSFSDPVNSLKILDSYDRGANKIELTDDALQRYIKIALQTACEFCCGATTLVFQDGKAACGCSHSAAMRGVAKYLIQKHGGEYSDAQILAEVNKWKTISFPKQMVERALASQGIGSVNLPSQVGGC